MSSLLAIQTKDDVLFASDTSASVTEQGISYRVSDNETKLFRIQDYILFVSGNMLAQKLFLEMIGNNINIPKIEQLLQKNFTHFGEHSLEVLIAEKKESETVIYIFSSYNNFKLNRSVNNSNETLLFTAGVKTKEIANSFEEGLLKSLDVMVSIFSSYQNNFCEQVGGKLEVVRLSTCDKLSYKLRETNLRRKENTENAHLIVGERIVIYSVYRETYIGHNLNC